MIRRLDRIQQVLREDALDGWLLYDFHGLNPIAGRVAGIPEGRILSRRWACFIPARGEPRWLVHAIEVGGLQDVVVNPTTYVRWQEWIDGLRTLLQGAQRVAMEVSPGGAIPTVSRVDGGTLDLVRSLGVDVVSSAHLIQIAEAVWTPEQLASHRRAVRILLATKDLAFALIREELASGRYPTELDVQNFIMNEFRASDLVTDHPPIVAVNEHAADPHYVPHAEDNRPIRPGDVVLIDMWARENAPDTIYGDITWMGYAGQDVPRRVQAVFDVVRRARDAVVELARQRVQGGEPVYGYELDDVARRIITEAGYGDAFIHRTGHSLGVEVHANGVNLDNLETQDRRRLIPGIGFTVEPGIYLPQEGFGIRLEIDCYVGEDDVEVTTLPLQDEFVRLA